MELLRRNYLISLVSGWSHETLVVNKRFLSYSSVLCKTKLKNSKKFTKSSQDWLTRQLNDPYVKLASLNKYR